MCVPQTERNRRSCHKSKARVRHGGHDAHEAFILVGPGMALSLEPLWTKPCKGCNIVRAPGARGTVERLHRHSHMQAGQLCEESTDSEAVG